MEVTDGSFKCEIASGEMFATSDQARAEIFAYLEVFYNRVACTPLWGSFPPMSLNGRTTRNTVNSVSIFPGEDQLTTCSTHTSFTL